MDNMPVEIITLPPEEWQAYKQIRLEALQDSPQAFGSRFDDAAAKPDDFWQTRLAEAAKEERQWLRFARSNGKIVGLMGAFRRDLIDPPRLDEAEIVQVYVTASARGQGVSTRLMDAILKALKDSGIRVAHLGVVATQTAALRLYQRFGFTEVKTEANLMGDGIYRAEIFMEKAL